ncbi:MAG: fructose-bisphosphate aldolase [Fimbriimonadia bacterium]|jgi:class I fructose-bisphosphate aldolase
MATLAPVKRWTLDEMDQHGTGKVARLRRLMYRHGPGNGTMLLLPIDQGLEHGPRDFFPNPDSADPEYELKLAKEGNFSAIVFQYGLAEKYMRSYAGHVPLVLKVNGKTEIPPSDAALSCMIAGVEDACRLGADAVGYTLYVGSPNQYEDFANFQQVRREAEQLGIPIIVWAYPRGEYVDKKGGAESVYAIDYAARVACELGSDVVKINFPKKVSPEKQAMMPKPYNELQESDAEMIRRVIASAGKQFVIISGGSKDTDEEVVRKVELSMEAGATGLIFGRNVWQRPWPEAMNIVARFREILLRYSR